jgi:hypothetical protein
MLCNGVREGTTRRTRMNLGGSANTTMSGIGRNDRLMLRAPFQTYPLASRRAFLAPGITGLFGQLVLDAYGHFVQKLGSARLATHR